MLLSAAMQDLLSRQARLLQAALDGHSQLVQLWELMEVEAEGPPMGPMQRFGQTRSEATLAVPLAASQELTQVTGPPSPVLQQPTLSTPPHVQQAAKRPLSPDTTRVHPAHPQAWPPPILAGCGQCATRVMDPALARSVQSIGPPEGPSTARISPAPRVARVTQRDIEPRSPSPEVLDPPEDSPDVTPEDAVLLSAVEEFDQRPWQTPWTRPRPSAAPELGPRSHEVGDEPVPAWPSQTGCPLMAGQ